MPDLERRVTVLETHTEAAQRHNIALLNALRETQSDHTRRLDGIDTRLDGIDTRLDGIDTRLDGIDVRLNGITGKLGGMAAGMHTIESLLRRALDEA